MTKQAPKIQKTDKISRESNLGEIVSSYPKTVEVLLDFGLHCVGCGAMHLDTVETGAKIHGLSDKEINELVTRLNQVVEFSE